MFDLEKYPYCSSGYKYALDVVAGDLVACRFVVGACQRFLSDLKTSKESKDCHFYFDPDRAERYLRLVQKFKHVKGKWKYPYIVYEPWQNFIFMNVKGFVNKETQEVRFRTIHVEVPRGNAKSTMASQAGLFDLSLDNPIGNEIYSAATGRDQAAIVLKAAMLMARKNKSFLKQTGTVVRAKEIVHESSGSEFKALSSDSNTLDGLQPKLAVIDELHAHRNRLVFDVIDSAMSKRSDSQLLVITTAGFDNGGIGYSQSAYAKKICLGQVEDETFFSIIYTIDEKTEDYVGDDLWCEDTWRKCNPGWGVSVDPINFKSKAKKAKETPDALNNFIVKHLNVWVSSLSPYFNITRWDECAVKSLTMDKFKGASCWVAIDLASKVDLTSFTYIFKEDNKYHIFTDSFIPEDTARTSQNDSYLKWVDRGDLIMTPGEAINYPKLQTYFLEMSKKYKFKGVMYDPWNATEFAQRMSMERINVIEFRMNTANLSEPMKKLDAIIREKRAVHSGNEVLRWCLGNVVAKTDANDNVFPRKENDKLKIDCAISTIMALAGYVGDEFKESVYEKRGLIVL